MANFTKINRSITAAVGAIVISTAFVAAAVGPAAAVQAGSGYAVAQTQLPVQAQQA